MEKEEFFNLIGSLGFTLIDIKNPFGDKVFETQFKSDGWSDGYETKYFLTFKSTFGIKFSINKKSVGGFTGTQAVDEKLFSGTSSSEGDFLTILKCIDFKN
jgi:hypothetical protein